MKRNKVLIAGILAIALTFALILTGCDNGTSGGSGGGGGGGGGGGIDSALVAKWHMTPAGAESGTPVVFEITAAGIITGDAFTTETKVTTSAGRISATTVVGGQTVDAGSADYIVAGTTLAFSNPGNPSIFLSLSTVQGFASDGKYHKKAGGSSPLTGTVTISHSGTATTGTTLTANYSGTETVTYQWKKGGTPILAVNGGNNQSFKPSEEGSYTVTVSAAGYSDKTSDSVSVEGAPISPLSGTITIAPSGPTTTSTQLTANYSGSEGTVTYQWNKDGIAITSGGTSQTYTPTMPGSYTVTISLTDYSDKTSAAVSVNFPELSGTITISPNSSVTTGTQLTASYSGGGGDGISYQWNIYGTAITGATSTTYTPTTTGSYTVTVSKAGSQSITSAAVTVITPVLTGTITISPSSGVTTYTKLTATYTGSENPDYQWKRNGSDITPDGTGASYTPTVAGIYTVTVSKANYQSKTSAAVTVTAATPSQQFRNILNNLQADSAELQTEMGMTAVVLVKDLTLTANLDVPSGVIFAVNEGKTLTVAAGATLNLDGSHGSLVLMHNATLTVNGTVYAKSNEGEGVIPGITIMPIGTPAVTINGSDGIIHLTTPGILLGVMSGQKLTLEGSVTLDGLTMETTYPETSTAYPPGIGGDPINNDTYLVHVGGELDMQGGTITGNYNTNSTEIDGGGVEINKVGTGDGTGAALFTMSGNAKVTGNKAYMGGGGVNVCRGGTFIMNGGEISGNSAVYAGGVRVYAYPTDAITTFIMNGGTIYGSDKADSVANKATSNKGASLYKRNVDTAKYSDNSDISLTEEYVLIPGKGTSETLTGK